MNPADKRITELLDRWLTSIELHLKYAALDEASYRQIQPWPAHERPARWVLEVAQQKVLQLKSLCHMHQLQQDGSFAEGLELMCFLANLVGLQHVQRFIPLADPTREKQGLSAASETTPAANLSSQETQPAATAPAAKNSENKPIAAKKIPAPVVTQSASGQAKPDETVMQIAAPLLNDSVGDTGTREMPSLRKSDHNDSTRELPRLKVPGKRPEKPVEHPVKKSAPKSAPAAKPAATETGNDRVQDIVIADAIRLLKWGREWHELADLIARMAERPGPSEVRRILKSQRNSIENQL